MNKAGFLEEKLMLINIKMLSFLLIFISIIFFIKKRFDKINYE